MFNNDSALVKIWVSLVLNNTYAYNQVPALSNLKTVVGEILSEIGYDIS